MSAAPVEANDDLLEGWRLNGDPVLGHRVVRAAVLESQDLHIVLSAGDIEDGGPTNFEIPQRVIRWLQTGEVNDD